MEREQAERHARQNKFNHLFHQEENLSLSSTKDPPGLNQLQTNLILRRDTGGINSSFQFNSAARPGRGKLSSITFMCLARRSRNSERAVELVTARSGKYVSTSGSADTVNVFTAVCT